MTAHLRYRPRRIYATTVIYSWQLFSVFMVSFACLVECQEFQMVKLKREIDHIEHNKGKTLSTNDYLFI